MIPPKKSLVFYAMRSGKEPVREWLKQLDVEDRRTIGLDLMRVQYAWPVGMPLCRSLGDALWEVRSALAGGRIARVLFCFREQQLLPFTASSRKARRHPKGI